jgi:hypothetical protein
VPGEVPAIFSPAEEGDDPLVDAILQGGSLGDSRDVDALRIRDEK